VPRTIQWNDMISCLFPYPFLSLLLPIVVAHILQLGPAPFSPYLAVVLPFPSLPLH
jgi:hypothetical protein